MQKKLSQIFLFGFLFFLCPVSSYCQYFNWAKGWGPAGGGVNLGYSTVTDAIGNSYTVGDFVNTIDFDPGPGTYILSPLGTSDFFIQKLDPLGNFVWAQRYGGPTQAHQARSITIDNAGFIIVVGLFSDTVDFDPGAPVFNLISFGNNATFVLKLDTSGNFQWVKQIDGPSGENAMYVDIDNSNNIYFTGYFTDTIDADPGPATYTLGTHIGGHFFVIKLDQSGQFIWGKAVEGARANGLAVDDSNNVFLTGFYSFTSDFDPGPGIYNFVSISGSQDFFTLKLDPSGNLLWVHSIGNFLNSDHAWAIDTDHSGNAYICGMFGRTVDFDPGPGSYAITGDTTYPNIFVQKISPSGSFIWAKRMGGNNLSTARHLTVDDSNNVYVTGEFTGMGDFDPGSGVHILSESGNNMDLFIAKLDSAGNFIWAYNIGDNHFVSAMFVHLDLDNSIFVTGRYIGPVDFNPISGTSIPAATGGQCIFLLKLSQNSLITGTENETAGSTIMAYPNPFSETITLKISKELLGLQYCIYNTLGQEVLMETFTSELTTLSNSLSRGVYYLSVKEKMISLKMVKVE